LAETVNGALDMSEELPELPTAGTIRDLLHDPPPGTERVVVHRAIPGADRSALFEMRREPQYLVHFRPLIPVHVESPGRPLEEGDVERVWWNSPVGRLSLDLRTTEVTPPVRLVDTQESGHFRYWRHQRLVGIVDEEPTLIDVVDFRAIPGAVGRIIDALLLGPLIRLAFSRHQRAVASITGWPPHSQASS
jgi:hypothetical protein